MVFCTKCGTKSEDDKKFCFNCGTKLLPKVSTESSPQVVTSQPTQTIPTEEKKQVQTSNLKEPMQQSNYIDSESLLQWAQYQAAKCGYNIRDWSLDSWTDGLGLCGIIHIYREDLVQRIDTLNIEDKNTNIQLAIDSAVELGISNVLSVNDLLNSDEDHATKALQLFVQELYKYFTNPQNSPQPISTPSTPPPQFTTLDQAMAHFSQTGEMPVLPGIVAQCGSCKKLGVSFKMLKIDNVLYCDGPCGRKAFVQRYKKK